MNKKVYIFTGIFIVGFISIIAFNMIFNGLFINETYAESANIQTTESPENLPKNQVEGDSSLDASSDVIVPNNEVILDTTQNISEEDMNYQKSTVSVDENGNTTIVAEIGINGYPDLVLEAGKPVNINFKADASNISTCNSEILINEFGISETIESGDNYVTITPTQEGVYGYTCWMGMLEGKITVVEAGSQQIGALPLTTGNNAWVCPMTGGTTGGTTGGGCCSF